MNIRIRPAAALAGLLLLLPGCGLWGGRDGDRLPDATVTHLQGSAAPAPAARRNLGLEVAPVTELVAVSTRLPQPRGLLVLDVLEGGAAAGAGLQPNDVILAFGPAPVASVKDLQHALGGVTHGSTVTLTIWRNAKAEVTPVTF